MSVSVVIENVYFKESLTIKQSTKLAAQYDEAQKGVGAFKSTDMDRSGAAFRLVNTTAS